MRKYMRLKYFFGIVSVMWLISSCTSDYMSFKGDNMVQFATQTDEVYTFAYFTDEKQVDTLNIPIMSVGEVVDFNRVVRFEQVVKEWKYVYDVDNPQQIVDSNYVDMEYPAVEGKHFEILESNNNEATLQANHNQLNLRVVVKRTDDNLKKNAYVLKLHLLPSNDFETGAVNYLTKRIVISDKLERPTQWKDNNYYCSTYLGPWSEVKHRFMINATGEKWDNDCIKRYIKGGFEYAAIREFYLKKIKNELEKYNADPKNNPPLRDENGFEVVFP